MTPQVVAKRSFEDGYWWAMAIIKAWIVQVGTDGTEQGFDYAEQLFKKYPDLRGA